MQRVAMQCVIPNLNRHGSYFDRRSAANEITLASVLRDCTYVNIEMHIPTGMVEETVGWVKEFIQGIQACGICFI